MLQDYPVLYEYLSDIPVESADDLINFYKTQYRPQESIDHIP